MFKTLKRVLIVDDSADQRLIIQMFVSKLGLEATTAENGMQAVAILEKQNISLIITDLDMPHLDGMQLIEWCRSHSIYIPIVLLSSNFQPLSSRIFLHLDCCSLLIKKKPIDFHLLRNVVHAADLHEHDEHCVFKSFKEALDDYLSGPNSKSDPYASS